MLKLDILTWVRLRKAPEYKYEKPFLLSDFCYGVVPQNVGMQLSSQNNNCDQDDPKDFILIFGGINDKF